MSSPTPWLDEHHQAALSGLRGLLDLEAGLADISLETSRTSQFIDITDHIDMPNVPANHW